MNEIELKLDVEEARRDLLAVPTHKLLLMLNPDTAVEMIPEEMHPHLRSEEGQRYLGILLQVVADEIDARIPARAPLPPALDVPDARAREEEMRRAGVTTWVLERAAVQAEKEYIIARRRPNPPDFVEEARRVVAAELGIREDEVEVVEPAQVGGSTIYRACGVEVRR